MSPVIIIVWILVILLTSLFIVSLNQFIPSQLVNDVKALSPQDIQVLYLGQWGKCGKEDGEFSGLDCSSVYGSSTEGVNGTRKIFVETFGRGPVGISVDPIGEVFVTDPDNNRVQKFSSNGTFLTKWGQRENDTGQSFMPTGIATDNEGNVYVVEPTEDRVQKFSSNGTFLTKWGQSGNGSGYFRFPTGIATDKAGNVYVLDMANFRIQKFSSNGTFLTKWGQRGNASGEFHFKFIPQVKFNGITTDNLGNVYVVDGFNDRVQKFSSNGTFITQWGRSGFGNREFLDPTGIATDNESNVYLVELGISTGVGDLRDQNTTKVQVFSSNGTYITKWGQYGEGNSQFSIPLGIAVSSKGLVYVTDYLNSRVQVFEIK
jgi:NHL repeat-containing protein